MAFPGSNIGGDRQFLGKSRQHGWLMPSIATEVFIAMTHSLPSLGLDRDQFLRDSGLSDAALHENERVGDEQMFAFSSWVRERKGLAAGIQIAEAMGSSEHFLLGYVLANSETLGDAYAAWVRYRKIGFEGAAYELTESEGLVELGTVYQQAFVDIAPGTVEGLLAYSLAKGRHLTGVQLMPEMVLLQNSQTDKVLYERFFGCKVVNNSDRTALVFDKPLMDLPIVNADQQLRKYLETTAQAVLATMPSTDSIVDDVRREIMASMDKGTMTLELLADKLHMSSRTLQRKLEKEGTSFGHLLDEVRQQAALSYLRNRQVAISEAAYLLGFSEPSTFYRAFKRWTGSTPADYRRSVLA